MPYHDVVTENQEQHMINLYAGMMEEVKFRILAIEALIRGQINIQPMLIWEISFLQLRMIFELIAIGCLVAHGDIEEATPLKKEWSADKIIARLSILHADFYPVSVQSGPAYTATPDGFLTKDDLVKLYGQCGSMLHRGSLKKILAQQAVAVDRIPDIVVALNKIYRLLDKHTMLLIDRNTVLVCHMNGPEAKVQTALAKVKPVTESTSPPRRSQE